MISSFEEMKESREHLISCFSSGEIPENFLENYTEAIDQYFRRSLQESEIGQSLFSRKQPFAFVAVGGYGRSEISLYSDIDIIILFDKKIPLIAKDLVKEVFYPLWDLGFDIGYGTRTIKDCLSLSKKDFEVLTSMMDARFICGDSPLYLSLMEGLEDKVISKKAVTFGKWLADLDRIRMDTFGDASYLLEPNLKDGIGGLRDYHHILWMAKSFFNIGIPRDLEYLGKLSHGEYKELQDNLAFIWLVRNHLHQISGRRNDRLGFEYQEEISERLGFQDQKDMLAVEQFMGRLHACMASIKSLHHSFVSSHLPEKKPSTKDIPSQDLIQGLHLSQGGINFDSATAILATPSLLMDIFDCSALLGCPLSMEAGRLVREFLYLVDDPFKKSKNSLQSFLNIINGQNTFETLDQMFETGFLDAFIPEFRKIRDRVQFDSYHVFPVGRHLLETVRHLKELPNQKEILLLDIFSDLSNPEPLFFAGLFHDIGKVGKNHTQKGVGITQKILDRIGYGKKRTREILFLVRHHLFLVETATRRDLNDEKVVIQCARTIENIDRLKMLYLLTWADSKATGPGAWNDWIASLVQELFFKILHIFERGELASTDASRKVKQTRTEVFQEIHAGISSQDLDQYFEVMSPRYLLNTSSRSILSHLEMVQHLKKQMKNKSSTAFFFDAKEDESSRCWEITFLAKDRPGIFSDIAGVLALHNINILSADIFTWRDGTAVDTFRVTNPLDAMHPNETWEKIKRDLKKAFIGKLSLPYRLSQKAVPSILSNHKKTSRAAKVVMDNESSDFFTVIEIFAEDRMGLLYQITHTLYTLRLDIRIAKIATKGDLIADVFYVRDLEGQKVEDKAQAEEIKGALLHELEQKFRS